MKLNQIITSLLETDMYKFSMGEAIYHQFSDYKTTWTFKFYGGRAGISEPYYMDQGKLY